MLRCRVLYALALIGAFLFHVFYTGYFSLYVLILALLFPFFSLAVSLPGILGCWAGVRAGHDAVRRGERAEFSIRIHSRFHMSVARVTLEAEVVNLLTGERQTVRERLSGASEGGLVRKSLECAHCGVLCFRVKSFRVSDLLGLLVFRRPLPGESRILVLPDRLSADPVGELAGRRQEGVRMLPRPGGGPGEDYDLRPYRPGDPLRSVHWKLSSKLDDLVVRETLEPHHALLLLTFDHFGPPEDLDGVLARLEAVSRDLLDREKAHYIQWVEPDSGLTRQHFVAEETGLLACLERACSTPAPESGPSILDAPLRIEGADGPIRHLHLLPREEGEEVAQP